MMTDAQEAVFLEKEKHLQKRHQACVDGREDVLVRQQRLRQLRTDAYERTGRWHKDCRERNSELLRDLDALQEQLSRCANQPASANFLALRQNYLDSVH